MNRNRGPATPAANRRTAAAPAGTGTSAAPTPPVAAAILLLCACGSAAYLKIDGVETSDRVILGPIQPNMAGKPQLSFCVTKGFLRNSDRIKSGAVMDDDYCHAHLADFLKLAAPFESIATIPGSSADGRGAVACSCAARTSASLPEAGSKRPSPWRP